MTSTRQLDQRCLVLNTELRRVPCATRSWRLAGEAVVLGASVCTPSAGAAPGV